MSSDALQCGKVYWCPECEVPLLTIAGEKPRCDICGSESEEPIYAASSIRPVFKPERDLLEDKLPLEVPYNIFYNRRRIIYRGETLFFFTLKQGEIALRKVNPGNSVKRSDLEGNHYEEYLRKAVEANTAVLKLLEREAVSFIRERAKQYPGRQYFVSFSGGKDSTVVAALVRQALGQATLFFANTTLEYDETLQYVKRFSEACSLPLDTRAAPNDIFEMSRKLGPPSRILRWCCTVFKAYPINVFWGGLDDYVLGFDGLRKAESRSRSEYPRVFQSEKFVRQVAARPILGWNSLAVWLYIYYKNLPFNPLYRRGYARLGCFMCPYNTDYDDYLNSYYEIPRWKRWLDFLEDYARKEYAHRSREWIDEWVHEEHWKQRKPRKRTEFPVEQYFDGNGNLLYLFEDGVPTDLAELMKPICPVGVSPDGALSSHGSDIGVTGKIGGEEFKISIPGDEQSKEFQRLVEKQIEKALNCVGCGGCIGLCPHKAISLDGGGIAIDNEICRHENCRLCVTADLGSSGYSCIAMSYKSLRRRISRNGKEVSVSRLQA